MTRLAVLAFAAFFARAQSAAQPQTARQHFERGRALYEEHDDTGESLRYAEVEFRLRTPARCAMCPSRLGFIQLRLGKWPEAENHCRKVLRIGPAAVSLIAPCRPAPAVCPEGASHFHNCLLSY